MKTMYVIAIAAFVIPSFSYCNQQAVTSDGKVVILSSNKTWKYLSDSDEIKISTNSKVYTKSSNAVFKVECPGTNFEAWINPKVWTFNVKKEDNDKKLMFSHRSYDVFGMIIHEQTEISIEAFKDIALSNARVIAPDAELKKAEYRMVNSNKVLYLEFSGTASGIQFDYYGYYASNRTGSIQFLAYCGKAISAGKSEMIESFLNGLSINESARISK